MKKLSLLLLAVFTLSLCRSQNTLTAYSDSDVAILVEQGIGHVLGGSFNSILVKNLTTKTIKEIIATVACNCGEGTTASNRISFSNIDGFATQREALAFIDCNKGIAQNCDATIVSIKIGESNSSQSTSSGTKNNQIHNAVNQRYESNIPSRYDNQPNISASELVSQRQMAEQRRKNEERRLADKNQAQYKPGTDQSRTPSQEYREPIRISSDYDTKFKQDIVQTEYNMNQAINKFSSTLMILSEQHRRSEEAAGIARASKLEGERIERQKEEERQRKLEEEKKELRKLYAEGLRTHEASFPEGSVNRSLSEAYFYASFHNDNTTNLAYTNVFVIKKRGNGSWPYLSDIMQDLEEKTTWDSNYISVAGYFGTLLEANNQMALSVEVGRQIGFNVAIVDYKPESTIDYNGGFGDPWGNSNDNKIEKKFEDPWGDTDRLKLKSNNK